MPINSGIWGENPNSDLMRYLENATRTGFNVSQHLDIVIAPGRNLTPSINKRVNLAADTSSPTKILAEALPELIQPINFSNDTLVLQADEFSGLMGNGQHAPPPLIYYRYILETRYWPKVVLVDLGRQHSPITKYLLERYPKITLCKGNLVQKWRTIAQAKQLVAGSEALAQTLAMLVPHAKRVWLPNYAIRQEIQQYASSIKSTFKLAEIGIEDYFKEFSWTGRLQQIDHLMELPGSAIIDNSRWLFTETEQCHSFELCQTCRDTSATGKLWRKMIAARFEVESTDWNCPHGWKWGGQASLKLALLRKLKLGSAFKKTAAALGAVACEDCNQRGEKMDGLRK